MTPMGWEHGMGPRLHSPKGERKIGVVVVYMPEGMGDGGGRLTAVGGGVAVLVAHLLPFLVFQATAGGDWYQFNSRFPFATRFPPRVCLFDMTGSRRRRYRWKRRRRNGGPKCTLLCRGRGRLGVRASGAGLVSTGTILNAVPGRALVLSEFTLLTRDRFVCLWPAAVKRRADYPRSLLTETHLLLEET